MGVLAAAMLMMAERCQATRRVGTATRFVEKAESQADHLKMGGLVSEVLWPQHGEASHRCYKLGETDIKKFDAVDQFSCQDTAASAGHKYYAYQAAQKKCETYESCVSTYETNHNEWVIYGCDAGYDWVNQQCQPFGGDCAHGELIALASRTQDNHCGSCDAGYGLVNQQCEVGVQMYGEYVAVEGLDQTFWEVRSEMGYEYQRMLRPFESFGAMLDWAGKHTFDWGWEEGGGGGKLFYQTEKTGYMPAFGEVKLWERPVAFDSADPSNGERIGFVRKDLLLKHPSWLGTLARSAYVEEMGSTCATYASYGSAAEGEDWVQMFNLAVGKDVTTTDEYTAWCNLFACFQFNPDSEAWCAGTEGIVCRNQCAATPDSPGGINGVCTRFGGMQSDAPCLMA